MQHKVNFLSRTISVTFGLLEDSEQVINDLLIPNLFCNTIKDKTYRDIISLPVREAGLTILRPEE